MSFRKSHGFGHLGLMLAIVSIAIASALVILPVFASDIKGTNIKPMGDTQVSWEDAVTGCASLGEGWSLPSIYQLVAIHYRQSDISLTKDTDYWSRNSFAGFAFGLNTGRGITSFDKHADTDHFLCTQFLSSK